MIQTLLALAIVMIVAVLIGFRPTTGPVEWIAAAGVLALAALAISWLSVALGMWPKDVETASNLPMFLVLLPFLSSAFVPTDSMPDGLSWFAENQPFTPIIETVRGLLLGTPIGNSGLLAVGWCVAISVVGYLWARRLYERDQQPARAAIGRPPARSGDRTRNYRTTSPGTELWVGRRSMGPKTA